VGEDALRHAPLEVARELVEAFADGRAGEGPQEPEGQAQGEQAVRVEDGRRPVVLRPVDEVAAATLRDDRGADAAQDLEVAPDGAGSRGVRCEAASEFGGGKEPVTSGEQAP
jgi:hypothetical protein